MDGTAFDRLARAVGSGGSRRKLLGDLTVLGMGGSIVLLETDEARAENRRIACRGVRSSDGVSGGTRSAGTSERMATAVAVQGSAASSVAPSMMTAPRTAIAARITASILAVPTRSIRAAPRPVTRQPTPVLVRPAAMGLPCATAPAAMPRRTSATRRVSAARRTAPGANNGSTTIRICPGVYNESITIRRPLTLSAPVRGSARATPFCSALEGRW
jgi:hypothetical protein